MKLFIGNIPGEALLVDIYEFLGGLQLRADFHAHKGQDADNNSYHYVVAELAESADLHQLIDKYNGMQFLGRALTVRKYYDRNPYPSLFDGENQRLN